MIELLEYKFFQNALFASVFGGCACSLIGVYIFLKDIPFLGIALSHAAFAGALGAVVLGIDPFAGAIIFCVLFSFILGPFSYSLKGKTNIAMGIIFSVFIGLAFLWLAMIPGPKTEGLNLIWGSILTISRKEVIFMIFVFFVIVLCLIRYFPMIRTILYNSEIASVSGIKERTMYYAIIFICSMTVSINLTTIGGILIFSLLINPAAAANQLSNKLPLIFLLAAVFGVTSCLIGLLFSFWLNLPCGALIVLTSSMLYFFAYLISPRRRNG
ncbi:MAG: metal ABC transporter permease [bacterium]